MDGKMRRWAAISCVLAAIIVVGDLTIDKVLKDRSKLAHLSVNCANCSFDRGTNLSTDIEDARNQITIAPDDRSVQDSLDTLAASTYRMINVTNEYSAMTDELVRLHDPRVNRILNRHLTKIQNILK